MSFEDVHFCRVPIRRKINAFFSHIIYSNLFMLNIFVLVKSMRHMYSSNSTQQVYRIELLLTAKCPVHGLQREHRVYREPGFLSSRPNGVPSLPHPPGSVAPPPFGVQGGSGREGVGGPNSDEEIDTLIPCVYYNLSTSLITIYAPMIYKAPCVMFLMRADIRWGSGGGGGGLALEIGSFVGPCEMARADRRVPFGAVYVR
jgi:hypothetical protein